MTSLALCVCTLGRPHVLAQLLEALAKLDDPDDDLEVRVVVVDNDPAGSAESAVRTAGSSLRWPVEYAIEPTRGIPFARNRAVRTAAGADLIAFMDDDEVPEPAWLSELVRVMRTTGADVVTGPVMPTFEAPPPAWLAPFYDRPRFATGTVIDYARTGNVLIAASVFPPGGHPFNEAMGLNGGDDTHFFMRAWLAGHRIVWADEAVVHEAVPASRVGVRWLLRREYRRGNTLSLCLRDLRDSWPRRLKRVAHAIVRFGHAAALLAVAPVRGRATALRGLQVGAFGAGLLSGLVGMQFDEYTVVHGR